MKVQAAGMQRTAPQRRPRAICRSPRVMTARKISGRVAPSTGPNEERRERPAGRGAWIAAPHVCDKGRKRRGRWQGTVLGERASAPFDLAGVRIYNGLSG